MQARPGKHSTTRPRLLPAGESALVVEFGDNTDPAHHDAVLALDAALAAAPLDGILETVPTYRSLMIHLDPHVLTHGALTAHLAGLDAGAAERPAPRRWRVPACYDDPHAEDLAEVAGLLDLPPERVAALHAAATYRVVMYGFAPGFVFLAGLPETLHVSRRRKPRLPAQPGALTVANGQALIASVAMPTGWYVLGRTPARTFDPRGNPMFPIAVGDAIAFERIDAARFEELARAAERGEPILVPEDS